MDFVIQEATFAANIGNTKSIESTNIKESELTIYPNPVNEYVQLLFENALNFNNKIIIFDSLGTEVFQTFI